MINVQIVDEHKLFAEGLSSIIRQSGIAGVSAVYYDLKSCRQGLQSSLPDILLLDIELPDGDGVDFCAEIKTFYPELKVIMVTSYNEYSIANRSLQNGAWGYVVKNAIGEEVISGIRKVSEGEVFLCKEIELLVKKKKNTEALKLSNKEKKVLELIAVGHTDAQIASTLCIAKDTAKGYRKDLLRKFDVSKSILLVNVAKKLKII
ncbi:MAG: response regulator transcription factor [Candidatus Symbiothrix sp.]|jgi:DNA-binding NarL/FixJ family response regulator|nr:response regulator transcription factor [Candidatus Symbiothrix sp.]